MSLKTVVKVGNISNLSEARYCSGMGVDMLGFSVMEGQPHFLAPNLFQEIRGWISGPRFVAEIYGIQSKDQLTSVIDNYAPDYFELSLPEYRLLSSHIPLPCIVAVRKEEVIDVAPDDPNVLYLLLQEDALSDGHAQKLQGYATLLKLSSGEGVSEKLLHYPIAGVVLNGSAEIRPGFKNYSELADILELLEE